MPSRAHLKGAEIAAEEAAVIAQNEAIERSDRRRAVAAALAQENYASWFGEGDMEVSTPDDNRGEIAVEFCDGGYWVSARVWIYDHQVEERME